MRFIATRTHGVIDYVVGVFLIGFPYIFGTAFGGAMHWLPIILGVGVIVYSLLTRYELGVARVIPMGVHLLLDIGGGALLAVSPWLFGFADQSWLPYLVIGLMEIGVAMMTRTETAPLHDTAATVSRAQSLNEGRR